MYLMDVKKLDGLDNKKKNSIKKINFKNLILKMPSGNSMAEEKQRRKL